MMKRFILTPHFTSMEPIKALKKQSQNPVVKLLEKQAPFEYDDSMTADFVIGQKMGVLFLSLKFHRLNTSYIESKVKSMTGPYNRRVLLLLVDIDNPDLIIARITNYCIDNGITVLLGFDYPEISRWLLTLWQNQKSTIDDLKASNESNVDIAIEALHSLGLSKREAESLFASKGTLEKCLIITKQELVETGILSPSRADMFLANISADF